MKSEKKTGEGLESIPGIGRSLAESLRLVGIRDVEDLVGKDPERLYRKLEQRKNAHQDRCVLYTFRCAVYYASTKRHDPQLLKWWMWSDVNMRQRGENVLK